MSEQPLLSVHDLSLTVPTSRGPVAVVDGLSFEIHPAESFALLGESGCGKTLTALSLLRLLPRGVQQRAGSIRFAGTELTQLSERELRPFRGGRMAMIFQEPMSALNPVLRVGFQIAEVLEVHRRLDRAARKREAITLLERVGLPEPGRLARRYPHELSGGMCQRVMIAMALAGEPQLLIADEPTTALDVTIQAQILDLLRELQAQRGLSILWISHDLGVVAENCDRVGVLYAGRLVETAATESLFGAACHPYSRGLMAALPRLDRRSPPLGIPGRVPAPQDFPTGCRFRDRCERATDRCEQRPELEVVSASHRVACWESRLDPSLGGSAEAGSGGLPEARSG